jgi:starch phosphorylase
MLRDPQRLRALLLDPERPVQIVVAGKAHPADEQGKLLIQELVRFADDPAVRKRVVFLPNYDIAMAQTLYPGCDVWLNNPLRPLEACGTSGMKAALNGALNLSVLDGWWDEWYDGQNGWAIPTADGVTDPVRRDDLEAAALYDLIEQQVAPHFYTTDERGIPVGWVEMIRHTLATLGPKVQATRMVSDYVQQLYSPAALAGRQLAAQAFKGARELAAWKTRVRQAWPNVRVDHVAAVGVGEVVHVGDELSINVQADLGQLLPQDVAVEVVHGRATEGDDLADYQITRLDKVSDDGDGRYSFAGLVPLDRSGAFGYGIRVVPNHPLLVAATDLGLVAGA